MVLRAFEMPLGLLFLSGKWHGWRTPEGSPAGFSSLPFEARERIIANILTSPIGPTRGVCAWVKLLLMNAVSCTGVLWLTPRNAPVSPHSSLLDHHS